MTQKVGAIRLTQTKPEQQGKDTGSTKGLLSIANLWIVKGVQLDRRMGNFYNFFTTKKLASAGLEFPC
jgi:hypothetical protein